MDVAQEVNDLELNNEIFHVPSPPATPLATPPATSPLLPISADSDVTLTTNRLGWDHDEEPFLKEPRLKDSRSKVIIF